MNTLTLHPKFLNILSYKLSTMLKENPVVLTLGSDKFTSDCFGPLTGYYLKILKTPVSIFGCLDKPLNATTLPSIYPLLKTKHKDSSILAVDSMIGHPNDVGKFKLIEGGIYPGSGSGKVFPLTGTVSLTAIVAEKKYLTRPPQIGLGFVNNLALQAAKLIHKAIMLSLLNQCTA
jgi:putative sporulation protein YyaC